MVKPDLIHTRDMLFFHHFILCNSFPLFRGRPVLDPALLEGLEGGDFIAGMSDYLEGANGTDLKYEDQFILKDAKALNDISEVFRYIFFIVCDLEYQTDLPSFFFDEWDPSLRLEDLELLGWTVYAFSEPALLFGSYPILIDGKKFSFDEIYINEWGLIRDDFLAKAVASKNNQPADENKGHWRPLAIYVDKRTHARLKSFVANEKLKNC